MIIGGPNGSGKSSAYENTDIEALGRSVWIINPDLLTRRIQDIEKLELGPANLEAVERIEVWLYASVRTHQTVGVETVLSTDKYRNLVDLAIQLGFHVHFVYVILDSPERNVRRVRLRVQKGGHDVPDAKVRERYDRSLQQLPWFLERADQAWVFDNSGSKPRLMVKKERGIITLDEAALPVVRAAVLALESGPTGEAVA